MVECGFSMCGVLGPDAQHYTEEGGQGGREGQREEKVFRHLPPPHTHTSTAAFGPLLVRTLFGLVMDSANHKTLKPANTPDNQGKL